MLSGALITVGCEAASSAAVASQLARKGCVMKAEQSYLDDIVAATFSYEFVDGGVDYDTIERIHRGEIDEWITALDASGLVDAPVLAQARQEWHDNPRRLFEALLADADEITRRRCRTSWAALDRLAPLAHLG